MSSSYTPEETERLNRADTLARLVFPDKHKGKFFRDAAKRLAKCTNIPYQKALDALQYAAVVTALHTIIDQMEETDDANGR